MRQSKKKIHSNLIPIDLFNEMKGKIKGKKKEEKIQIRVCEYIKENYPDVIFQSDLASGMKLPIWIAAMAKKMRSSKGLPDMMIFEPRGGYSGLCIELKAEDTVIKTRKGEYVSNDHIKEQAEILSRLSLKGYRAVFAVGYM